MPPDENDPDDLPDYGRIRRPQSKPAPFAFALDDAPIFLDCPCGRAKSTILPCHHCVADREAAAEAAAEVKLAGIPEEFDWATLEALKVPELAARIKPFPNPDGVRKPVAVLVEQILAHPGSIVFWGKAGTGKSSTAALCLRARGRGVFVSAEGLLRAARGQSLGRGDTPLEDRCFKAPLLVIDDLGAEKKNELSPVEEIIRYRWTRRLPTWTTTGLSGEEIHARYGDGVGRRLTERPRVWIVAFGDRPQAGGLRSLGGAS